MDLTKFRITGLSAVNLPVIGASVADKYLFKGADGLGPTENDVSISKGKHQASVPRDREIVVRIGLNPDYGSGESAGDLRTEMYGVLSGLLTFDIMNDETVLAKTLGTLKRCEIIPFAKDPEVQVTIACLGPYLEAPAAINPNLSLLNKSSPIIDNVGTAPTGFSMELEFTAGTLPDDWWMIRPGGISGGIIIKNFQLIAGDNLIYNTNANSMDVYINRPGVGIISLLSNIHVDPMVDYENPWLQLSPGSNEFDISYDVFDWVSFQYTPKYLGI